MDLSQGLEARRQFDGALQGRPGGQETLGSEKAGRAIFKGGVDMIE